MGSSSDFPITPWMRNQERMEREALAAGRKFVTEEDYYAQREAERKARIAAAARRPRGTHHEDEHPIDPREVRC